MDGAASTLNLKGKLTISLVSNPRVTATDSYNIPVGLCRPSILVKQHQIFTKWLFGSALHNTYQGSALVSWPINRCLLSTQQCAILFLVTQEKGKDQKDMQVYKNKTKHNKKESQTLLLPDPLGLFSTTKALKARLTWSHPNSLSAYFLFSVCSSPAGITVRRRRLCKTNMME